MSKEKAIDKINQAIFLIKPYFEGNLEAKRFTLKYLEDALKELEDLYDKRRSKTAIAYYSGICRRKGNRE